jgi:hypothetical protein
MRIFIGLISYDTGSSPKGPNQVSKPGVLEVESEDLPISGDA